AFARADRGRGPVRRSGRRSVGNVQHRRQQPAERLRRGEGVGRRRREEMQEEARAQEEKEVQEEGQALVLSRLPFLGLAVAGLLALPGLASAATIGHLPVTPEQECTNGDDWLQSATVPGLSYVVPAGQTVITSWSTSAGSMGVQQLTFKVFRA